MAKLSPERNNVEPSGGSMSCKYKGVRKRKWGKWVSEIRLPNSRERIWLGSYDSPEKAARAFDAALFCLRGGSASFNFPDSPPDIEGGRSLSHAEIQTAAARFANSGTTTTTTSLNQAHSEDSNQSPSPTASTPSISDWNIPMESDYLSLDAMNDGRSCWDLLTNADNMNYSNTMELNNCYAPTEYGIFPGFDDLSNNFYVPTMTTTRATSDNGDETFDGALVQEPFLWSF